MLEEFRRHNLFLENFSLFQKHDPHLAYLRTLNYVAPLDWWAALDWACPGIFILTGGRQIGKSTSTKLLIEDVLRKKTVPARSIFYLPADQILDHAHLTRLIRFFLEGLPQDRSPFLLIVDEVTFVKEWDRSIKALADEAWFRRGFCILTGSDSVILKEAASRFPGRRGKADQVDFHLLPLTFKDYLRLVSPDLLKIKKHRSHELFDFFSKYLRCGGYLRAINDLHSGGQVTLSTYATFEQWVKGDFSKRGKSEENLLQVLQALFEVGVSQSSYSNLTKHVGHLSKDTLIEYMQLLERMDIVHTLEAYDSSSKIGFPKKAKKFHFADPFIQQTLENWLIRERRLNDQTEESFRVESCVVNQYFPKLPCYYLKAEGEIDLVIVLGKRFLPVEVKWTRQLRPKDLIQLKKYKTSVLLSRSEEEALYEGVRMYPLPQFLIDYDDKENLGSLLSC